jgi:hypothetical protein
MSPTSISPLGHGPYRVTAPGYVPGSISSYAGLLIASSGSSASQFPLSQLIRTGANPFAQGTIAITGTWVGGTDTATATINGHAVTYDTVSGDTTNSLIAQHLAAAINADSTDKAIVFANAEGNVVNITALTPGAAGEYSLAASKSSTSGVVTASGAALVLPEAPGFQSFPNDLTLVQFMLRKAFVTGSGGGSGIQWDPSVDAVLTDYVAYYG